MSNYNRAVITPTDQAEKRFLSSSNPIPWTLRQAQFYTFKVETGRCGYKQLHILY